MVSEDEPDQECEGEPDQNCYFNYLIYLYHTYRRMLKYLLITCLFIFCGIRADAQRTLETCQQQARMNYPAVRQFGLIEKSKEFSLANAGKAWYPQLSVNAIGAWIIKGLPHIPGTPETDDFQFIGIAQLSQNIWDGGTSKAQKHIITATAAIDSATTAVQLYELRDRVNQLYFGILLIDEQLAQLELLKETLHRNHEAAQQSLKAGMAYRPDVDEVQVEVVKAAQREIEFKSSRLAYMQMLSLLIGEQVAENEKLSRPEISVSAEPLTIRRPELQLYESQRRLADAQLTQVKTGYMPKLNLLGAGLLIEPGFTFGAQTMNSLLIAGLGLSWNTAGLYTGKKSHLLNRINVDKINNQQETFLFNTNLRLLQSQQEVNRYRELLNQDDEIIRLRKNIREAYEVKYDNGMAAMNDVLNAVTAERESMSSRSLRELQLLMSIYSMQNISGN